jgi:hypothetical protein
MEIIMGSAMLMISCLTGMTPILFSLGVLDAKCNSPLSM